MNEHTARKSRVMTWSVVTLMAVFVLYLLAVPWLEWLEAGEVLKTSRMPYGGDVSLPTWFIAFEDPWYWLLENTPLSAPMSEYLEWCRSLQWSGKL